MLTQGSFLNYKQFSSIFFQGSLILIFTLSSSILQGIYKHAPSVHYRLHQYFIVRDCKNYSINITHTLHNNVKPGDMSISDSYSR